jgi:WD40 repeat protein
MTDDQLELRLRDWYRTEVPPDETAPTALRAMLTTIPHASARPHPRFASRRGVALLAAAALLTAAIVGGALLVGSGIVKLPSVPPSTGPSIAPAGVWTTTGRMISGHDSHTATLLLDGRVLVAGAYELEVNAGTHAELFEPRTGSWSPTGPMTQGRAEFTATLLRDGRVLAAGGGDRGNPRLATAELYDPATGVWTATGSMTEARDGHSATLLLDGRVLVAGGGDRPSAELYDPRTGTWTATGNMVGDHFYDGATLLPDGTVLVAGGSAELYDPSTGTWSATGPVIHGRSDFGGTLLPVLPDRTVLVEGGADDGGADDANSAELYDPSTGEWSATGAMIDGRYMHAATLMPDGTVLVTGGHNKGNLSPSEHDSAELYDPATRTWTATARMNLARRNHTATLLHDGRVLVVGGIGADGVEFSAELYDTGTRPPSPTPSPSSSPDAAVVASPSPQLPTPSSSPEPCVLTGDARPPVDPVAIEGLGQSRGVYVAGRPPMLWAVNPGQDSATLIASIPPDPDIGVLDISPDGSNALIRLRALGGSTSECAGLYLIRTDGLGATRLTTFGRVPTGAFSPDGRRIAYSRSGAPGTITTLDLETGATVDQLCGSDFSSFQMDWSPSGERIAVSCDFSLTILDAAGTTAPVRFMTGGEPLAFTWTDDRQLVVATNAGETYSFDVVSQSSSLVGRFGDTAIEIVIATGVFSPDGRWLAYHGGERGDVPGDDFTEVGYLVPTSGGTPTRMPDEAQLTTTWSGDSRALVYITSGQLESQDGSLVRMDVETLQSSTIGSISDLQSYFHVYRQGVWRVP